LAANAGEALPTVRGVLLTLAGGSLSLVAGGQLAAAAAIDHWARAMGLKAEGAFLTGWFPAFFNAVALAVSALLGAASLLLLHELPAGILATLGFILALLIVPMAGLASTLKKPEGWKRAARIWDAARSRLLRRKPDPAGAEAALSNLRRALLLLRQRGWRGPMAGAALNFAFDVLTLYFLFRALGHPIGPGVLLAGYGLPLLIGRFSFLPGGVGVVEGSMAGLYRALGVPATTAVSVALAYRLLSFWLPNLAGFPVMLLLQSGWRSREPPENPVTIGTRFPH
jgi:uncharacterized membrane protein YbhN (UPF0104 family)